MSLVQHRLVLGISRLRSERERGVSSYSCLERKTSLSKSTTNQPVQLSSRQCSEFGKLQGTNTK